MKACICTHCGAEYTYENEAPAFCSKCGHRLSLADGLETELTAALKTEDTGARYEKLLEIRAAHPDAYPVEFEILCIGRMHERGGKPDFYRIPFWPLAAFETPKQFSKREREKMLVSFFENEDVMRVAALSEDEDAFYRAYYLRMARGYVDLCLKGRNSNASFWGFKRKPQDVMKRCAGPLKKMIENIENAGYPSEKDRGLLAEALRQAFILEFKEENAGEFI